jgi:DnaJ-class molecular chaperone
MDNLYETLGCNANSSLEELKQAFQKLALMHHPDKTKSSDSTKFTKIKQAWEVLSNEDSRKEYDTLWKQRCLFQEWPIQDELSIDEFEDCGDEKIFDCRCGGQYVLRAVI